MPVVHFLNVSDGDCSIIQHVSGRVTMIDVCKAGPVDNYEEGRKKIAAAGETGVIGNFNQREYPVNPNYSHPHRHGPHGRTRDIF